MPRRYIEVPNVVREDLGDGDWVDVKVGLLWGDLMNLWEAGDVSEGKARRAVESLIQVGIVAWGGPGFEGLDRAAPDSISRLAPPDALRLFDIVVKRNPWAVAAGDPKGSASADSAGSTSSREVVPS